MSSDWIEVITELFRVKLFFSTITEITHIMFPVGTLYSALGAGTAQAPALLASYFISAFFVTQIFFSFYFNVLILNLAHGISF